MYKVFIIEDEYLIRNNLREQITVLGSYYPITYVGEAGDGEIRRFRLYERSNPGTGR